MKSLTGRLWSRTSETRSSSASRPVSPWLPSARQLGCQAPKSSSRSWARVISLTRPAPFDVRSIRRSCTHTRCPSRVSRTSHSTPSAPSLSASSYAARVCSGRSADAPRCATTNGWPPSSSSPEFIRLCCRVLAFRLNRNGRGVFLLGFLVVADDHPALGRPFDRLTLEAEEHLHGQQQRRHCQQV